MRERHSPLMRFLFSGVLLLGCRGCALNSSAIPAGTYEGEIPCEISAPDGSGGEVTEPFTVQFTVVVDASGSLTINGEPAEVGAEHLRAIPTADLTFEVVGVVRTRGQVEVTYEPRPTLTGIDATGTFVETYASDDDGLAVTGEADLIITDIDGPHPFSIACSGVLAPSVP